MKIEVTRDVVSDLWPLYRSGDVTAESKALVEQFLAADSEYASTLKESASVSGAMPVFRLSPDAERRLLDQARGRARLKLLVIGGSVALAGFIVLVALAGAMYLAVARMG